MKLFSVIRGRATRSGGGAAGTPDAWGDLDIDATSRLIMTEDVAGRILLARRLAAADIDTMDEVDEASEEALEEAIGYGSAFDAIDAEETASADR
jgi:hypothetical protein